MRRLSFNTELSLYQLKCVSKWSCSWLWNLWLKWRNLNCKLNYIQAYYRTIIVECVFSMVVVSLLPHAEFGSNNHRDDAPHFIGIFKWQRLIIARLMIFEKCIPWDGNDRVDTQQQDGFWVILYYSWRWLIWYESYHTWVIWWVIWWVIPWVMIHMASKWKPI